MYKRRILILEACGTSDEPLECEGICKQADLYGLDHECRYIKKNADIEFILSSRDQYDYIYLSAHGDSEGFDSDDGIVSMSWKKFAQLLCEYNSLNEDSKLLLSCCRGGLMQVAYDIFLTCNKICYVLGPRQSLTSSDMHICFGIFLYNVEIRNVDPVVACDKILKATDQRFSCYDREEEAINLENYRYMNYSGVEE